MRFSLFTSVLALGTFVEAGFNQGAIKAFNRPHPRHYDQKRAPVPQPNLAKRAKSKFLNKNSEKFAVNGSAIPEVDFDVGESYAGLLPISQDPDEERELFFWFFPSTNVNASEEVLIW